MTKLESKLETLFTKLVRQAGAMTFKLAPTHVGMPDRMVVHPGGAISLVELKTDTGTLSPAQVVLHARLAALGRPVVVLYGEQQIREWAEERMQTGWGDRNKPGRFDDLGEWWACDPYPTWYRWEGKDLVLRPYGKPWTK